MKTKTKRKRRMRTRSRARMTADGEQEVGKVKRQTSMQKSVMIRTLNQELQMAQRLRERMLGGTIHLEWRLKA